LAKILRNRKALSPVVASIILIAVTVAVAIAVAVWMGGLTIGLMGGAEQLNIIDVSYGNNTVSIEVANTGTGKITITDIRIDGVTYNNFNTANNGNLPSDTLPYDLEKGASHTFTITFSEWPFESGVKYEFTVLTAKGNMFGPYVKVA